MWLWILWIIAGAGIGWGSSVVNRKKNYPQSLDVTGGLIGAVVSALMLQLFEPDERFIEVWYVYSSIVVLLGAGLVIWLGRVLR